MKFELIGSTGNMKTLEEMLKFSQNCARVCYSKEDYADIEKEPLNMELIERMIKSGHHSVFEHINLTFYIKGIPKILAMILNNEKQYATSEKSARYTQMSDIKPEQKEKYDKWMEILIPEIGRVFPRLKDSEEREKSIKKLAQENARYMTSVFTPTKMVHTVNLRQLNFLIYEFERFREKSQRNSFNNYLSFYMERFLDQVNWLKVDGLENQTRRKLSFLSDRIVEEKFGEAYSTSYLMSFAGLAQAHRHRTINYNISGGTELEAPLGFFIPDIIPRHLRAEWIMDLREIAESDFPQAQLVRVNERGIKEDFISKMTLRLCGHAQYEIMENTLETALNYAEHDQEIKEMLSTGKPQCTPNGCRGCHWGNRYGINRIV